MNWYRMNKQARLWSGTAYHGTVTDMTGLNPDKKQNVNDFGIVADGLHFSLRPEVASANAIALANRLSVERDILKPAVITVNISLSNPFPIERAIYLAQFTGNTPAEKSRNATNRLKAQGYDGMFILMNGQIWEVVAFNANSVHMVNRQELGEKSEVEKPDEMTIM